MTDQPKPSWMPDDEALLDLLGHAENYYDGPAYANGSVKVLRALISQAVTRALAEQEEFIIAKAYRHGYEEGRQSLADLLGQLQAIAITAERLCRYDGSKTMSQHGHFYDAAKAYEYSERLHELLDEWRKGQKEGRWTDTSQCARDAAAPRGVEHGQVTAPKAKRKRPKARYMTERLDRNGTVRWAVCNTHRQVPFDHLCECFVPSAARRIAAALNLHEAVRRGEL